MVLDILLCLTKLLKEVMKGRRDHNTRHWMLLLFNFIKVLSSKSCRFAQWNKDYTAFALQNDKTFRKDERKECEKQKISEINNHVDCAIKPTKKYTISPDFSQGNLEINNYLDSIREA